MYFIYIHLWDVDWSLYFLHVIDLVKPYWFSVWHIILETCAPCLSGRGMWSFLRVWIFPSGSLNSVIILDNQLFELF